MPWVAIRHGDDHIHIVAMLARQDGRRPIVAAGVAGYTAVVPPPAPGQEPVLVS